MSSGAASQSKPRAAQFELLRIIAMCFILLLHADFLSFGAPSTQEIAQAPVASYLRIWLELLSIVAVDCFILISGYFGIKSSLSGLAKLLFLSSFYSALSYIILCVLMPQQWSEMRMLWELLPLQDSSEWFLRAYCGLYLLSPLLNRLLSYLDSKAYLGYALCLFYLLHTGFAFSSYEPLRDGYSTWSFLGLYMLGYYIRQHQGAWQAHPLWSYLLLWLILQGLQSLSLELVGTELSSPITYRHLSFRLISYASPLNLLASTALFVFFSRIQLHSPLISRVGGSVLAVYLLHCNGKLIQYYIATVRQLAALADSTLLTLLYIAGFLGCVFALALALDQVRIRLWKGVFAPPLLRCERWLGEGARGLWDRTSSEQ